MLNCIWFPGPSTKKSISFETLIIQNKTNVDDLTAKLKEVIAAGKNYEYDVSSCIKSLLLSKDESIVLLTIQAVSELAKCENQRETYAQKEIIVPILTILSKKLCIDKFDLIKQSLRALGNLCCDCDVSRKVVLENNGIQIITTSLGNMLENSSFNELKILTCKAIMNFAIGGKEFSISLENCGVIDHMKKILMTELSKEDMNDDLVSTILLILSVINDNSPDTLFDDEVNIAVLNVLKETSNVDLSELALEHLHSQIREHGNLFVVMF